MNKQMNDILTQVNVLYSREKERLDELEQIRSERVNLIKELKRQVNNIKLTRYQAADILEYNYYYMSRLDIPFKKGKIHYLDLLEWLKEYQPGRIKRVEKNFKAFLKERGMS